MAFVTRLVGEFSLSLKIAWGVWFVASYALIMWRRHGRTDSFVQPAMPRPRKVKAVKTDVPPTSKRRWRLRPPGAVTPRGSNRPEDFADYRRDRRLARPEARIRRERGPSPAVGRRAIGSTAQSTGRRPKERPWRPPGPKAATGLCETASATPILRLIPVVIVRAGFRKVLRAALKNNLPRQVWRHV